MKNLKRALSFALATVMLIGMMVVGASAADFGDADQIEHTEAVETLVALNVINGKDDGNYDPTGIVTRAEMAKLITVALNGGKDPVLGTKAEPTYTDIKGHWAEAYIEYCASLGIISGRGDGTFDPNGTVTGNEAAKMMLVAMGWDTTIFNFTGANWAINVGVEANKVKLFDELETIDPSEGLTRDNTAQLVYNGILADTMEKSPNMSVTNGNITWDYKLVDKSIFSEKFGGLVKYGYMTKAEYDADKDTYSYNIVATTGQFGAAAIPTTKDGIDKIFETKIDASELFGQQVKIIYKDDKNNTVYGIYANDSTVLASGTVNGLPDMTAGDTSFKFGGTTFRINAGTNADKVEDVDVYAYNVNTDIGDLNTYEAAGTKAYSIDLIDNDGDGKVNCAVVSPYTVTKVTYVGKDTFNTEAASNVKFEDVNTYEGIAKNDFVLVVAAPNTVDNTATYAKIETIEGKVEATKSGAIQIDGTWYNYNSTLTATFAPALKDTYELAVVNGFVTGFKKVASAASIDDYAVVTKAAEAVGMNGPQVQLLFADGTKEIVDAAADYKTSTDWTGRLVTYEINSDDEYVLTWADGLTDGTNGTSGFDKKLVVSTDNNTSYTYKSDAKSTIAGETIADDAVIFTVKGSTYKVITGADLRKYATTSVKGVKNAFADSNSVTGFNNVALAYVTLDADVITEASTYGYVTSTLVTTKNADDKTVTQLSFWNGSELIKDVLADKQLTNVAKGSIIKYEEKSDGSYSIKLVENLTRGAIVAYNEANDTIRFTDGSLKDNSGTNVNASITKDTVIIGINSDDVAGVEGVVPAIAVETSTADLYKANVYYMTSGSDPDKEVVVLVIDTYNDLPVMPGNVALSGSGVTSASLQNAVSSSKDVTVDAKDIAAAVSVKVPEGTKLTITDTNTSNVLTVEVAKGATVEVKDTSISSNNLVVKAAAGATVKIPNGTLFGDVADITTGTVTMTANGTGVSLSAAAAAVVTINKDLTLGAADTIDLVNITLKGNAAGVKLVVRDESKLTNGDSANFYKDTTDTTADAIETATYKWTTISGETIGWLKQ